MAPIGSYAECIEGMRKTYGITHIEVLQPTDDDGSWYEMLDIVATNDLAKFISWLKWIICPFNKPTHFIFKGPLTNEQSMAIHKMGLINGDFISTTTNENGMPIMNVFITHYRYGVA